MSDREGDKPRILVVDDEQMMAKTVADILGVKGYDAETAFSGSEAVEKVNRKKLRDALGEGKG